MNAPIMAHTMRNAKRERAQHLAQQALATYRTGNHVYASIQWRCAVRLFGEAVA
ncbi:MAG: hypothetical protein ACRCYB_13465 [Aeromonas veronii]